MPEGDARLFTFSSRPELPHSLHKALPDDWRTQGDNVVYIHAQTAGSCVLTTTGTFRWGSGSRETCSVCTSGRSGDIPHGSVWLFVGVAPLVLFVSGLLIWWNRTVAKILRRRRVMVPGVGHEVPRPSVAATSSVQARGTTPLRHRP